MRYADPALCPDCRGPITPGIDRCPTCDLVLRHRLGVELFGTLTRADAQLAELRRLSTKPAVAAPPVAPTTSVAPTAPPAPATAPRTNPYAPSSNTLPSYPAAGPSAPPPPFPAQPSRTGLSSSSVPKILLGLGALCLLVAAVIFLAVSWSALGVGGRTAVLAGLTLSAGAASLLLHRVGLRIAAEALSVVALGLLALDVIGGAAAGWFGDASNGATTLATGLIVGIAAVVMGAVRINGQERLVAPQIIVGIATMTGYVGVAQLTDHTLLPIQVTVALTIGGAALAQRFDLPGTLWSLAAVGGLLWTIGALLGLGRAVDDPSLHELWIDGAGWSLLATAAAMTAPGLLSRNRTTTLVGASCSAVVATAIITLPTVDSGATVLGLVTLATTIVWALGLWLLPRDWRVVATTPAVAGAILLVAQLVTALAVDLERWTRLTERRDIFRAPFDVALDRPDQQVEAAILVPAALVVLFVIALLLPGRKNRDRSLWLGTSVLVGGLAGVLTLASYDVPLVAVIGLLLLVALVATALGRRAGAIAGDAFTVASLLIALSATSLSVPNDIIALTAGATMSAIAASFAFPGLSPVRRISGGIALPIGLSAVVAAAVAAVGADAAWVAVPVLLIVTLPALIRPRLELEIAAAVVAVLALPGSLEIAEQPVSLGALWLAVAGCIACASALLHTSRRPLAFVGALLLLLATWVRLLDLRVDAPEAYTLPLAVAMIGFGLHHLQRNPGAGTAPALLPGLLLAVVPSLLWVLGDPLSLRALLLGAGCLVLTIAGSALRWSAPLVVGAVAGSIVVLREIGPYASDIPQWVWIGLAGALLTIVGITWERQLLELRKAVGAVARLR